MARADNRDLDAEARRAGYPGGRREREAFRRATKAALKKGAAPPPPPSPKAKYKPLPPGAPGGRGRKVTAPASRAKGRWHGLGSGGRVKTTGQMGNLLSSLKGARSRGEQVFLTVKGRVTKSYDGKPSDEGEAALKGWSPATILAAVDAAGGDVRAALSTLLEGLTEYDSVEDITSVTIRAYRG